MAGGRKGSKVLNLWGGYQDVLTAEGSFVYASFALISLHTDATGWEWAPTHFLAYPSRSAGVRGDLRHYEPGLGGLGLWAISQGPGRFEDRLAVLGMGLGSQARGSPHFPPCWPRGPKSATQKQDLLWVDSWRLEGSPPTPLWTAPLPCPSLPKTQKRGLGALGTALVTGWRAVVTQ